jgi:peptide-methionine (R)-S-oxide reductase
MNVDQINNDLSDEQKDVLFKGATEAPGSGELLHNKKTGMYTCANCTSVLFASGTKFESGSGWPSFYEPANLKAVELVTDDSHGMTRTEVRCKTCGGHLGHLFDDAHDEPTGQRFCINSASLGFKEQ